MKYLSVCSGIEAASVAWKPLGFEPVAFSETDAFPSAVLAYHFPDVPNLGDMTQIDGAQYRGKVDILVGGTPCQAFSVAGKRESLNDDRGNLTLKFVELCDAINPDFIVWENVPGVLSTKDNAFGHFIGAISGYGKELEIPDNRWTGAGAVAGPKRTIAWRILDAQYFGVAQRRRRVFLAASPRNRINPCEILFEREGLRRDSPPCRKAEEETAGSVEAGSYIPDVCPTLTTDLKKGVSVQNITTCVVQPNTVSGTLCASGAGMNRPAGQCNETDMLVLANNCKVRRLMPVECERLQGFPDNWTNIPYRGKTDAPDTCRYKAIGNSMCVNVMRWIGERIKNTINN